MAEIIIFIFSGIFIGIAAGLFGLGGGLVIVPVVTYCLVYFSNTPFDQAIIIGISTSLASMVITVRWLPMRTPKIIMSTIEL